MLDLQQDASLHALNHGMQLAIRRTAYLLDNRLGADRIEVFKRRFVGLRITLGHNQDRLLLCF